jgi:hypothetical protein
MTCKENWSANERIPSYVSLPITVVKETLMRNDTVEQKTDKATVRDQYYATVVMEC